MSYYTDDDIEMAQAAQDADELAAYLSTEGKAIDEPARKALANIAENDLGGSLLFAMTVWLAEEGYATDTDEANDAMFKALFS